MVNSSRSTLEIANFLKITRTRRWVTIRKANHMFMISSWKIGMRFRKPGHRSADVFDAFACPLSAKCMPNISRSDSDSNRQYFLRLYL